MIKVTINKYLLLLVTDVKCSSHQHSRANARVGVVVFGSLIHVIWKRAEKGGKNIKMMMMNMTILEGKRNQNELKPDFYVLTCTAALYSSGCVEVAIRCKCMGCKLSIGF